MSIERKLFTQFGSKADNIAEVLDWLGALPSGVTMDAANGVQATLNSSYGTQTILPVNYFTWTVGSKTARGAMIQGGSTSMFITTSNRGTDAVLTSYYANSSYYVYAVDLEYTVQLRNAELFRRGVYDDITSFVPVTMGETYTPYLFATPQAQNLSHVGTIIAGGVQYANDGHFALRD